ncbi:MAG: DUF2306 domain-containing protein [Burkholderiales bacterium]
MNMPLGLFAFFSALGIWSVLLVVGFKRRSFGPFVVFGIAFLLLMNIRYLIEGAPTAIAFFIGIYDVLDNFGLRAGEGAAALATCPNNACSVWGDTYLNHPSWGTAFHDRFLNGTELRTNLLYAHLTFNSIVFVLMHVQLWRPGTGSHAAWHKIIGRVSFGLLTLGTIAAIWLAGSHGSVGEYGGNLSMYGFWFMSLCVYGCAVMGVSAIRQGDKVAHRIWMIRFAGSMWGAFWLFRVMLFVLGPLLRDYQAANLLTCIWLSAPLGILIAEVVRIKLLDKRPDHRSISSGTKQATANA